MRSFAGPMNSISTTSSPCEAATRCRRSDFFQLDCHRSYTPASRLGPGASRQKPRKRPRKTGKFSANKKWAVSPLISPPAGAVTATLADKLVCILSIGQNAEEIQWERRFQPAAKKQACISAGMEDWIVKKNPLYPMKGVYRLIIGIFDWECRPKLDGGPSE
jgi:hypothetical protein